MEYYIKRDNAYRHIKAMLNEAFKTKKEVSKIALMYVIYNKFQVGELALNKWLVMFEKLKFIKFETEDTIKVLTTIE